MLLKTYSIILFCLIPGLLTGCRLPGVLHVSRLDIGRSRDLMLEAASAQERNDLETAETKLAKAVKINENDGDIRSKYAEVLWQHGKKQEAVEQLLIAVKKFPNDARLFLLLSEQCYEIGNIEMSQVYAGEAIKKSTQENKSMIHRAWTILARIQYRQGHYKNSLASYHKALMFSPQNPELLSELAALYESMNHPDRALVSWQKASHLYQLSQPDSEPEQIFLGQGNAYMAMGRYHEAAEQFLAAQQRWPNDTRIYCRLAQAKLALGEIAEARQLTEQAMALAPQDRQILDLKNRVELAQLAQTQNPPVR
ncbi:MAG: tetratricopeptide repeat protein [Planctomycetaceae bacterium]|nr:tetratricopeptide repeat protein [Planctomycetaceae bacterium]